MRAKDAVGALGLALVGGLLGVMLWTVIDVSKSEAVSGWGGTKPAPASGIQGSFTAGPNKMLGATNFLLSSTQGTNAVAFLVLNRPLIIHCPEGFWIGGIFSTQIQAHGKGSYLEARPLPDNSGWFVEALTGTWTLN